MSPKEGIFTAGLIAGIIVTYMGAQSLGLHRLVGIVAGLVVGAGIGYVAQQAYIRMTMPPDDKNPPA